MYPVQYHALGKECTPECSFTITDPATSSYRCINSGKMHLCTLEKCTYLKQLDLSEQKLQQQQRWICTLTRLIHSVYPPSLSVDRVLTAQILQEEEELRIQNGGRGDEEEEDVFNQDGGVSSKRHSKKKHTLKSRSTSSSSSYSYVDEYFTQVQDMSHVIKGILEACNILTYFTQNMIQDMNAWCKETQRLMIQTKTWKQESHTHPNYTSFYHVLMVLFNLKKKDGLMIPVTDPCKLHDIDEIPELFQVLPSMEIVQKHFPDERQLRSYLSQIHIIELVHPGSNSPSSSNSSTKNRDLCGPPRMNIDHFTAARHLFHKCLTEWVRSQIYVSS